MKHAMHTPDLPDVDKALTRYFRAAVPERWPACPQTTDETTKAVVPFKSRSGIMQLGRRLSVAAAVAALVVSYHAFTSGVADPRPTMSSPWQVDKSQPIGFRGPFPGKLLGDTLVKDLKDASADQVVDPKKVIPKK